MTGHPLLGSVEILSRLIAFDTTSRNSNLPLIDWVREYLDGFAVPYRLSHDATGEKANLHAVIGPQGPGGVALSGHVDTVPVDGQAWTTDPFRLVEREGRLFGRGSTDMKGFVACCLAAVPDFLAAGLRRPIHLFISYDEEVGCLGAHRLCADLFESGQIPETCIVGEPTSMRPVVGHKGYMVADVAVRGHAGHSSLPAKGVNALYAAAEAVAWVAAEQRRIARDGPFAEAFDPPHSTVHVGLMSGGAVLNIIPEHASFRMEWRMIPGDDPEAALTRFRRHIAEAIEPAMKTVDPATGFAIDIAVRSPGLSLDPNHALASTVRHLTGSNGSGYVSYGTEAGIYEEAGIASIVCGPGDIVQAHKPDEFIARAQLDACDAFLRQLALRQAG